MSNKIYEQFNCKSLLCCDMSVSPTCSCFEYIFNRTGKHWSVDIKLTDSIGTNRVEI